MSEHNGLWEFPQDFTGIARLFPIPNRVMFPHVLQPLRIHEPKYCELLRDALRDDQMIATAFTRPGWKPKGGSPGECSVVCLGRLVSCVPEPGGEHSVLMLGMSRAVVRRELATDRPYRTAEVALLDDVYPSAGNGQRIDLQHLLVDCFAPFVPDSAAARRHFQDLTQGNMPLGILTDVLSFMIGIDATIKQALLTERNVDRRARILVECLQDMQRTSESSYLDRPFPPFFSSN